MTRILSLTAILAALAPALSAQPMVGPPNFSVQAFGGIFIQSNITSMAADARGNVYLVEEPGTPAIGARVHRIRPDGTPDPFFVAGLGGPGQLAYNPQDGSVYLVDTSPVLPVINSRILRMTNTGSSVVGNVPVVAQGFTIDNAGTFIVGGTGVTANGLFAVDPLTNTAAFLDAGHGSNRILQALVSDDVIIADGRTVRRWIPGSTGTVPFFQARRPNPNEFVSVTSLARRPFNQLGAGAMIGVRDFLTLCSCGEGRAFDTNLQGVNTATAPFATERFGPPQEGFTVLANGVSNDLYWATIINGFAGRQVLVFKIEQLPAMGEHGSLFANISGGQLTIDLYGRPIGADPILLGGVPLAGPGVPQALFVPGFGPVDLDPFASNYIPLVDGAGLLGPPDPFGQTPAGGAFSLSFTLPPPGTINLTFALQGVLFDDVAAPNGGFTLSQVENVLIP